jgi:hypothetical protein
MNGTHLGRIGSIVLAMLVMTAVPVSVSAVGQTANNQNSGVYNNDKIAEIELI